MNVGIVGLGFMGTTHFRALREISGARVTALCTRSQQKLAGDWRGIKGNFGSEAGLQDLSGIRTCRDIETLLADDEIELVDICLPTHLHRPVAEAALQAGKHVLVEKPIAGCSADAEAMVETAKRTGKLLMVGHVLRFYSQYQALERLHRSGTYGKLQALHFRRVISKPLEREGIEHRGGAVLDLHIHDINLMQMLLGSPHEVQATGRFFDEFPIHATATYVYDDVHVSAITGYLAMPTVKFEQGYTAYFEDATVHYNSLLGPDPILYTRHDAQTLATPEVDPFQAELQYVIDACNGRHDGALLSAESARDSLLIVERVTESMRRGRPVQIGS